MPLLANGVPVEKVLANGQVVDKVLANGDVVWEKLKNFIYSNLGGLGWLFDNTKSWTADEDCMLIVTYARNNGGTVSITCNGTQVCDYNYNASGRNINTRIYRMARGNTISVKGSGSTSGGGFCGCILTKFAPQTTSLKTVNQGGATQSQSKTFTASRDCLLVVSKAGYDWTFNKTVNAQSLHYAETTDANRWCSCDVFYFKKGQTITETAGYNTGIENPHRMIQMTELYI